MDQYKLQTSGFNGSLAATVSIGNEVIETFPVNDIKDAQKKARAVALRHREENRPARVESYTEHFSL